MTTRWTMAQLLSQMQAALPDNATQVITPAHVRLVFSNFMTTMSPSFASLRQATTLSLSLVAGVPKVIAPWSVVGMETPPEMVANATAGTLKQVLVALGNAVANVRATFFIGASGSGGIELVFTLYANGVATDVVGRVSTTSASNVVNVVLTGILSHTVDTAYDIRVTSPTNGTFTFTNGNFRLENVPVPA